MINLRDSVDTGIRVEGEESPVRWIMKQGLPWAEVWSRWGRQGTVSQVSREVQVQGKTWEGGGAT